MRTIFLPFASVLFAVSAQAKEERVVLDGGSARPVFQRQSYSFSCPDGVLSMDIAQKRDAAPSLTRLRYGRRSLTALAGGKVSQVLGRLRAVESVSARCLTGGGVHMLITGLERDRVPNHLWVVGVNVDRRGQVSLN